jgi:hypothetical protein
VRSPRDRFGVVVSHADGRRPPWSRGVGEHRPPSVRRGRRLPPTPTSKTLVPAPTGVRVPSLGGVALVGLGTEGTCRAGLGGQLGRGRTLGGGPAARSGLPAGAGGLPCSPPCEAPASCVFHLLGNGRGAPTARSTPITPRPWGRDQVTLNPAPSRASSAPVA